MSRRLTFDPDEPDGGQPEDHNRPVRALAAAVLLQAVRDARDGNAEAAAWVTDVRTVELWAVAAGRANELLAAAKGLCERHVKSRSAWMPAL